MWCALRILNGSDDAQPPTLGRLIPSSLRSDRFYSGVAAQQFDASDLADELIPSGAGGVDDGVVVIEQAVREEALLEVEPQALDRIELASRPAVAPA